MKLGIKSIGYTASSNILLHFLTVKTAVSIDKALFTPLPISHLSGEMSSSSRHEPNGILYNVQITATLPHSMAYAQLVAQLEQGDYVFLVEDMKGDRYLVGCNHFYARLSAGHDIDKMSKNIIRLEINHESPHGELPVV